jgi:hypothetical protein
MSEKRDLIIQHNFTYNIQKMLRDKLLQSKKLEQEVKDDNGKANKRLGDKDRDNKDKNSSSPGRTSLLTMIRNMQTGSCKMEKISRKGFTSIRKNALKPRMENLSV